MSAGFGFSIGDLIAGIKLIKTSIEAAKDAKSASSDFASLIAEISTLEDGLEAIEELQLEGEVSLKQGVAIDSAVSACKTSIDEFCSSIAKYQPHLRNNASGLQATYRRIKWALCKKEDVANFRNNVARHASSINMLLVTFQIKQSLKMTRSRDSSTLAISNHSGWDHHIVGTLSSLSIEHRQYFLFLMQQNKQLLQSIEDLGRMMQYQNAIPPQVLLGRPVVLLDCFGKTAPFHLEFIDSFESFLAVMKIRFKQAGVKSSGIAKLENHEFSIQDTRRKSFIDVTQPWPTVFQSGQNVDMSMVFHRFACPPSTCPACYSKNEGGEEEVNCQTCGLAYQSFQAIKCQCDVCESQPMNTNETVFPYMLHQPRPGTGSAKFPAVRLGSREDEIFQGYRRVQIISQTMALLHTRYPALVLMQDFRNFAELLLEVPINQWEYLPRIRELQGAAAQHLLRASRVPAFSTISHVDQSRRKMTEETISIRENIDGLMDIMFDNDETRDIVDYIKQKHPPKRLVGYYTSMLIRRFNASSQKSMLMIEARNGSSSPKSSEQMQWRLLDSRFK